MRLKKLIDRKSILIIALIIAGAFISTVFLPNVWGRLFYDTYDISIYEERGSWLFPLRKPYIEVFSEYPQIATIFFTVPHILVMLFQKLHVFLSYSTYFSLLMATFLFISFKLVYRMRIHNKRIAFLIFLPASLYFTYHRFDIMPCLFSLLSLWFLYKKRTKLSFFILAIAVFIKWYPILLLPIFVKYLYDVNKKIPWAQIMTFLFTAFIILGGTYLWIGWEGITAPYTFHLGRGGNAESFYHQIGLLFSSVLGLQFKNMITRTIFFFLQFIAIPLCLISKLNSFSKVLKWSTLSIMVFVFFAKFYSPQWILWFVPVFLLFAERKHIMWIIAFDIVTYLYFPIIFDFFPHLLQLIILVKNILLLILIVMISTNLVKDNLIYRFFQRRNLSEDTF